MTKTTFLIIALAVLGTMLTLNIDNIHAASDTLPGGTNIAVTVDNPSDLQVFHLVDPTVDVAVTGTADIGVGTTIKDTTIVYILDISGSMNLNSGVDCDGVSGLDTRLVCAKVAIRVANNAAADPNSAVDETGLGTFEAIGMPRDVDLGAGTRLIVSPDHDGNGNSIPDIVDVVNSLTASGGTNYFAGLQAADTILGQSTNNNAIIVFISDGDNIAGNPVNSFVPTNFPDNTVIKAFAIGATGVSCSTSSSRGDLNDVAALGNEGSSCTRVTDMSTLADVITESIDSTLTTVEIDVNGAGNTPADSTVPPLPQTGPASISYTHLVSGLGAGSHQICATASGSDAGGDGSVTECVTILVNTPPVCTNAAPSADVLWPANHKFVKVTLDGVTDPDGDDVTIIVTSVLQDEPTNGLGDGDHSPDAIIGQGYVELRAERSGTGDGRVYEISFQAEDTNGGMCTGSVNVTVPHSKNGKPVINSGLDYDSTLP